MNKEKVYLEGYVVGRVADTLGYKGLLVQLENLDTVEIDENLVHKDINELRLLKLKDVIKRIEKFDLATKAVWINEILNKLGSDYGIHKYYAGYKQGKFDGAIEHEKVTVPQFVADWYEENKDDFETRLFQCIDQMPDIFEMNKLSDFEEWIVDEHTKPFQTLVNMHQFGYTVEKEKRYLVRLKNAGISNSLLKRTSKGEWWFRINFDDESQAHTRKELEEAGFGEVFNSPLFEIEEVEE